MEYLSSLYKEGLIVPPLGSDTVQTYTDDGDCWVMTAATKQPKEVINTFVDLVFGSVVGNLEFTYGISDNYQIGSDKVVKLRAIDEITGSLPTYPGLMNNLDIIDSSYVVVTLTKT